MYIPVCLLQQTSVRGRVGVGGRGVRRLANCLACQLPPFSWPLLQYKARARSTVPSLSLPFSPSPSPALIALSLMLYVSQAVTQLAQC